MCVQEADSMVGNEVFAFFFNSWKARHSWAAQLCIRISCTFSNLYLKQEAENQMSWASWNTFFFKKKFCFSVFCLHKEEKVYFKINMYIRWIMLPLWVNKANASNNQ